ncbi:energy-coupling factor ABC transporter ATP-binding protein [Nisaea acidiphila]|uniref:Energy-coupling factor ABC transporter ATP-binding protein n=1 Tax=Nisaea acidiphila TaxID=1862145 RepID=A0A9J7AWQ7_9PROT|nr:energy-coupling factor ABC transporter ATP-binding protein [Nisaea acidiphila]
MVFENACVEVPGRTILRDISLSLSERRIAIIGANGSGKSTFARLLNGLAKPSSGRVLIDGIDTAKAPRGVRALVGFLFQDPDDQIVMPLVEEDLRFSLKALKLDKDGEDAAIERILSRFGLKDLRQQPAHYLSGGEKQLLALANILLRAPRYLVLDEPTTLLDLRNRRRILDAMDGLEETVICVTHDLEIAAGFERVLLLDSGRVLADGAPADVIARYRSLAG